MFLKFGKLNIIAYLCATFRNMKVVAESIRRA